MPSQCLFFVVAAPILGVVGFDAALEESHEIVDVEVVPARRHELFSVPSLEHVVRLGIYPVGFQGVIRVYLAEAFEHLSRVGGYPFVLGKHFLVVGIERHDHVVVAQDVEHLRVGPYAGFHFAAVDAPVTREVDEERFADLCGIGLGFFQVEEPFEAVGQVQEIAVLGFLSLDGQQHARFSARSGRRFLPDHEILRMQRRQVAREAFERGAPHAGDQVYDEREGDDGQCQAAYAQIGRIAVMREFDFPSR